MLRLLFNFLIYTNAYKTTKSPDSISLATDSYVVLSVFLMASLHAVLKLSDVLSNMLQQEFASTSGLVSHGTQLPGNNGAAHQSISVQTRPEHWIHGFGEGGVVREERIHSHLELQPPWRKEKMLFPIYYGILLSEAGFNEYLKHNLKVPF